MAMASVRASLAAEPRRPRATPSIRATAATAMGTHIRDKLPSSPLPTSAEATTTTATAARRRNQMDPRKAPAVAPQPVLLTHLLANADTRAVVRAVEPILVRPTTLARVAVPSR